MGLREDEPPHDPTARAERIAEQHRVDEAGLRRAIERALMRCGMSRGDAGLVAAHKSLKQILTIAANSRPESV